MELQASKVINGTFGMLWVNGSPWMDVQKFELKVGLNYEDVNVAEKTGKRRKFMGWTGTGSITVSKVYSRGALLLAEGVKSGNLPEITMVGKLADPSAYGKERVSVEEITFDEFTLMAFELATLGTEEFSFEFGDFDIIESIVPQ